LQAVVNHNEDEAQVKPPTNLPPVKLRNLMQMLISTSSGINKRMEERRGGGVVALGKVDLNLLCR
jgi:hypothetical protein